jgi:hypothetical protein
MHRMYLVMERNMSKISAFLVIMLFSCLFIGLQWTGLLIALFLAFRYRMIIPVFLTFFFIVSLNNMSLLHAGVFGILITTCLLCINSSRVYFRFAEI